MDGLAQTLRQTPKKSLQEQILGPWADGARYALPGPRLECGSGSHVSGSRKPNSKWFLGLESLVAADSGAVQPGRGPTLRQMPRCLPLWVGAIRLGCLLATSTGPEF